MDASTSSRYRITMRPRTSDCSAPAARNSRPDMGTTSAHGSATVCHDVTISPVTGSWVICCSCSCTLWRSLPDATAGMSCGLFPMRFRDPLGRDGEILVVPLDPDEAPPSVGAGDAGRSAAHREVKHRFAGGRVRLYQVLHQR